MENTTAEHLESAFKKIQNSLEEFTQRSSGEHDDLNSASDVLLLADVFENFRKICLKNYELDPVYLITSPSLAWLACLKMSQQPLELFTSIHMQLLLEKVFMEGFQRYAKSESLFTDTDSLTYEIESDDMYKDMGEHLDAYDTSDYPQ
ncbi:hypothetical protein TNCV_1394471 [Trichonephila clavipes]|nr:hypothetical protein TNCV_1394471 [Trichonephila clavipes]